MTLRIAPLRIALASAGAFGEKHLDGLMKIDGVKITSITSRTIEQAEAAAKKYGAGHFGTDLAASLERDHVDAVILCTPTQMHAEQAIACMDAGSQYRRLAIGDGQRLGCQPVGGGRAAGCPGRQSVAGHASPPARRSHRHDRSDGTRPSLGRG